MVAQGGGSPLPIPIYTLGETAVTAGQRIATGIAPFVADMACTILFDMNISTNPSSGNGRYCRFIDIPTDNIMLGKKQGSSPKLSFWWMGQETQITNYTQLAGTTGRFRFCVTHEANSDDVKVTVKNASGTKDSHTISATFVATSTTMSLGYTNNVGGGLLPGTINSVRIYDSVLSDDAITAFFA